MSWPRAAFQSATSPRVSIGWPPPRPMRRRTEITRGAARSAAAVSPRVSVTRPATLSAMSSWTAGAPGASVWADGRGSYSTSSSSRASSAA